MIQMVNSCWFKEFWVEMEWPQSHGKRICHKWIWAVHSEGKGLTIAVVSCWLEQRSTRAQVPRQPRVSSMPFYAIYVDTWSPNQTHSSSSAQGLVKMEETDRIQAGAVAIWHWAYPCFESAPSSHAHSSLKHCL